VDQSLEKFAAKSKNVVVCKSMSKVYALSGVRAAYLCGPAEILEELRAITPPWAVSLSAQLAAVAALHDPDYYAARYAETNRLREELADQLSRFDGWEVLPGLANFILCHLPDDGPDAATLVKYCRAEKFIPAQRRRDGSLLRRSRRAHCRERRRNQPANARHPFPRQQSLAVESEKAIVVHVTSTCMNPIMKTSIHSVSTNIRPFATRSAPPRCRFFCTLTFLPPCLNLISAGVNGDGRIFVETE